MKKLVTSTLILLIFSVSVFSQSPQAFKYQAIVRNNFGDVSQNQAVGIRISIHDGSLAGTVIYQETFVDTTNQFGLVNLEIGNGAPLSGTFSTIEWGSNGKFLEVEIDEMGGTNYQYMGTSQLLSVPYAMYSGATGDTSTWRKNGNEIYYNNGNVGIGTANPEVELEVNGQVKITGGTPGSKKVLASDAAGLATWQNQEIDDLSDAITDTKSIYLGENAGISDYGSNYNTALGIGALSSNTNGFYNNAQGYQALYHNTSGKDNTAFGHQSLFSNVTGDYQTAFGVQALYSDTAGIKNTAMGLQALYSNTTGSYNNAMGFKSLFYNTTGEKNTAIGYASLYSNTTGDNNTAVGFESLAANTTGEWNTAFGYHALRLNNEGSYNTAVGQASHYSNTSGGNNTVIGALADYNNQHGSDNTIIGYSAGKGSGLHTKSGNVFIGNYAGYSETGSNKLYIDNSWATNPLIYGDFNSNYVRINNNLGIGTSVFGNGTNVLALYDGVAPSVSITSGVLLYAEPVGWPSIFCELRVRDEYGNTTTLSPHNFSMVNKSEPMAWSFYSENSEIGKKISVDMLRMVRVIEEISGEKLAFIKSIEEDYENSCNDEINEGLIQKQQCDIDELKKMITELKTQIDKLEKATKRK